MSFDFSKPLFVNETKIIATIQEKNSRSSLEKCKTHKNFISHYYSYINRKSFPVDVGIENSLGHHHWSVPVLMSVRIPEDLEVEISMSAPVLRS